MRAIRLLDGVDTATTTAPYATARHAFIRTPATSGSSTAFELRIHDSETGQLVVTTSDPLTARIEPPFALMGGQLLAIARGQQPGALERALVAIDAEPGAVEPSWRYPLAPDARPDASP